MDVFTSIAINYLPKARLLAETLKKFHPNWKFHLLISDRLHTGSNLQAELANDNFDHVVWVDQLDIPNIYSWIFTHTVVELCTAVKGPYLNHLVKAGAEKIMYIDPDIAIFNDLNPLEKLLDAHAILLTPHLVDYEDEPHAILDNEILGTMRHGIYNLGFIAINSTRPDGKRFSEWWQHRLLNHCYADYEQGLFTDQKWCDMVPAFFEDHFIVRDPGYNVASWNINKRHITIAEEGQLFVNEQHPLRFYHFTGYDSGAGNFMTRRYSDQNSLVDEIWAWYAQAIKRMAQDELGSRPCFYNFYSNGSVISKEDRKFYRENPALQAAYPNPFEINEKVMRTFRDQG
jgi:lipopolysaccharide biosynthesis glycosyltransferase